MIDISKASDNFLDSLYEDYREFGSEYIEELNLENFEEPKDSLCQNCGEEEIAEDSYTHCDGCRYF